MSIEPSAVCPTCGGRRWVEKELREIEDLTWDDLQSDPSLLYKPCDVCNPGGQIYAFPLLMTDPQERPDDSGP